MLKMFAIATLLGGISIFAGFAGPDPLIATQSVVNVPQSVVKVDRADALATSSVRNYMSPRTNGGPVAFCLSPPKYCGKHAADAFCRSKGFDEALSYQRETMDPTKLSFRQIKCRQARAYALMTPHSARLAPSLAGRATENVTVVVKNQAFPLKS
jgi:hypothetical protein